MAQLLPNVYQRFTDANGLPLSGGKLYSYQAGTTVLQATYTDQGALTPNPNPVILDSAGGAQIWIKNTGYKLVLTDSLGNIQWTVDQVYLTEPGIIGSGQIADGSIGTNQIANQAVTTGKIQTGAITTALLAAGSVTSGIIANGAVTISILDPAIDLSQLTNSIEIVFRRTYDLSGSRLTATPQYPWSNPSQQVNPQILPAGQGNAARISPDGRFLAVAHNTTPFVTIYERSGTTWTKLANPGTLPAGNANALAWSPNGDFLTVAHVTTPFITIYQRTGNTFTKLSDPLTLPASDGLSVDFSPNGEFLAVSSNAATGFNIYQISGTTFTDITGSAGIANPAGCQGKVKWSQDSQYLALTNGTGTGSFLTVFQRKAVTFSACTLTQPATLPVSLAFSPDNTQLIGGFPTSPAFVFSYSISGTVLTGPNNPFPIGTPPAASVVGIAIAPNGRMIAVVSASSPYLQIYVGDFTNGFVLQSNPANLPAGACNDVSFSSSSQWLSLAVNITPFVQIYVSVGTLPASGVFYSRTYTDV